MGDCLVCGSGIVFYGRANNKMDLLHNKKEIVMTQYIDKGITRIVFKLFVFAIKLANPFNGHLNFLQGCLSNYKERQFYKSFKDYEPICNMICPSYFCSYFGLVQVQKRCDVNTKELTNEELEYFKPVRNGESKPQNFGFIGDKMVCLDYA